MLLRVNIVVGLVLRMKVLGLSWNRLWDLVAEVLLRLRRILALGKKCLVALVLSVHSCLGDTMDKQDQDIVWLAQRMGIPPEIALKMFKEGAMNSEPQMGAEPFNFIIEDDRNLPTGSEFPDYVTPDPSGMNVPATSPGIFDWLKGIYGQKANPMQGSGMQMDPQAQALFGMIKKLIGG